MRKMILLLIAILAIGAPVYAQTEMLTNGSFDTGTAVTGYGNASWTTLYTAPDEIANWTFWDDRGTPAQIDQSLNFGTEGVSSYKIGTTNYTNNLRPGATGNALTIYAKGCDSKGWSCGVYQTVNVQAGQKYTLDGWWTNFADSNLHAYSYEIGVIQGAWINNPDTATNAIWKGTKNDAAPNFDWKQLSQSAAQSTGKSNIITVGAGVSQLTVYVKAMVDAPSANSYKERLRVDDLTLTKVTPVPEPSSIIATLSGLIGFLGFGIRRRK